MVTMPWTKYSAADFTLMLEKVDFGNDEADLFGKVQIILNKDAINFHSNPSYVKERILL